jgi:hypothetical protein
MADVSYALEILFENREVEILRVRRTGRQKEETKEDFFWLSSLVGGTR